MRRCEHCGRAMIAREHRQTHPVSGKKVCSTCLPANAPEWNMTYANQHVAHDSGDGEEVAHCAFCGSGALVGGADGTIECQFCHRFFTVQVQPEFKAMPQTINGQPFNIPGMPGGGPDAGATQDARAQEIGDAQDDEGSAKPFVDDSDEQQATDAPKKPNPFAKGSMLVAADGSALPLDSFVQHLALHFADDRDMVLAQVREENRRGPRP